MSMEAQGDWDLRGRDWETVLVGPVTELLVDADRQVRVGAEGWGNGFPNWYLYRVSIAGDDHLNRKLADWCIAFSLAYLADGGVAARLVSEEFGAFVGWDCFMWLRSRKWMDAGEIQAEDLGISGNTYRRVRDAVLARQNASLAEYWPRLQIGIRQAALINRRIEALIPVVALADGTGWEKELPAFGDGNYRAYPKGSGC